MYNIYINNYIYLYVLSLIQKMGYMCAPTYANIFMSEFEERFIYPLIKNKSSSYLGFKTIFLWCGPYQRSNLISS